MTTTAPPRTFADLEPGGLELEITCQRCGHVAVVEDIAPDAKRGEAWMQLGSAASQGAHPNLDDVRHAADRVSS
jgi:hypothetical protein